jgi:hypothetical protein
MKKINKLTIVLFMLLNFGSYSLAENNFFEKGKNKYDEQKYEESKFLFQRSIVFNPKDQNSYLYLAKIYNFEENKKEELPKFKIINRTIINLFIVLINTCSHFLLDQHYEPYFHKNQP